MKKLVCVGLDPDYEKIPKWFSSTGMNKEDVYHAFITEIVDLTAPYAGAFKIQKAFYDSLYGGKHVLLDVVQHIKRGYPDIPVYLDCKIGDIDNTMDAYLDSMFNDLGVDGVVVNPYMGIEVFEAFNKYPDKTMLPLVRTSNPGAWLFQDAKLYGQIPVWEYVLGTVMENRPKAIPIIASTAPGTEHVRRDYPQIGTIFVAGYGAQGGDLEAVRKLRDADGGGILVNSSRGILYPYDRSDADWREKVVGATERMHHALNS